MMKQMRRALILQAISVGEGVALSSKRGCKGKADDLVVTKAQTVLRGMNLEEEALPGQLRNKGLREAMASKARRILKRGHLAVWKVVVVMELLNPAISRRAKTAAILEGRVAEEVAREVTGPGMVLKVKHLVVGRDR